MRRIFGVSFVLLSMLVCTEALVAQSRDGPSRPANGFVLEGNYPNPFNPSTTITYDLPESGSVSLIVFDALGRAVATLVDQRVSVGSHSAVFETGAEIPSGMYFARLSFGKEVRTTSMLLLR